MPMTRNVMVGLVHKGAKALLRIDDTRADSDDRKTYEDWLWQQTQEGERGDQPISCADLDSATLSRLIDSLRESGAYDGKVRGGRGDGATRPTPKQLAALAGLSRDRGWSGLSDVRLQVMCRNTCKVNGTRFMSRNNASDLILAMKRWNAQTKAADRAG